MYPFLACGYSSNASDWTGWRGLNGCKEMHLQQLGKKMETRPPNLPITMPIYVGDGTKERAERNCCMSKAGS